MSSSLVGQVKYKGGKGSKWKRRKGGRRGGGESFDTLLEAKQLVDTFGGVKEARDVLDKLDRLR